MVLIVIDSLLIKFCLLEIEIEERDPIMLEFLFNNDYKTLVEQKTCFKSTSNSSCIGLFVTNSPRSSQNTATFASGLSDFHKMILTKNLLSLKQDLHK